MSKLKTKGRHSISALFYVDYVIATQQPMSSPFSGERAILWEQHLLEGNGEFAVALRSALIEDNHATLFAGCGIVAASQPENELVESSLKLQASLRGLDWQEEQKQW